jgi:hypothetical protein
MEPADFTPRKQPKRQLTVPQKRVIGFILVLAATNVVYRLIYLSGLQRTAALYVGVPTFLAIGLIRLPNSASAVGMLMKGSTLAALIACVILPEGLICLLFALPLMLLVALILGAPVDAARRRKKREGPTLMAVSVPLLILSLEGVIGTPFDTDDRVTAHVVVDASADSVGAALAETPVFGGDLPSFLQLGFNRPVSATGSGIEIGDERTINFTGGTHDDHPLRLFGLTGTPSTHHQSTMHLTVVESGPGRVVFTVDEDGTMLSRWVTLHRAVVTWTAVRPETTVVSWSLEYERRLFPSAYFAPLQRYGMDQAADYLLDSLIVRPLS